MTFALPASRSLNRFHQRPKLTSFSLDHFRKRLESRSLGCLRQQPESASRSLGCFRQQPEPASHLLGCFRKTPCELHPETAWMTGPHAAASLPEEHATRNGSVAPTRFLPFDGDLECRFAPARSRAGALRQLQGAPRVIFKVPGTDLGGFTAHPTRVDPGVPGVDPGVFHKGKSKDPRGLATGASTQMPTANATVLSRAMSSACLPHRRRAFWWEMHCA